MIDGTDSAFQSWNSLEEQLLPMTKEKEIILNESQMSLKKGNLSLDEYLRKFKNICYSLAAVKNPVDEINKVFKLARGLGPKYKDFSYCYASTSSIPIL
ncbi:hypothetical protein Dsin_021008 [Dipteronia sinensis]|uniref:Uncharacterized protein n=1 Tax=Dipteronia sinensis TaxID=43782 RepID=A0AAE0AAU6_9ROSI|nr:hypothetical protein Dsin_021008 [Dipteronia sinensis]